MADIFVPIKTGAIELSWIVDDVAMELAGIKGNNSSPLHVFMELRLGPANNQRFRIALPRNDATDRERIIPAPRRTPVTIDPDGGYEVTFQSLMIERVY